MAREKGQNGDLDGAVELSQVAIDDVFDRGAMFLRGVAATVFVASLPARGAIGHLQEARSGFEPFVAESTLV